MSIGCGGSGGRTLQECLVGNLLAIPALSFALSGSIKIVFDIIQKKTNTIRGAPTAGGSSAKSLQGLVSPDPQEGSVGQGYDGKRTTYEN